MQVKLEYQNSAKEKKSRELLSILHDVPNPASHSEEKSRDMILKSTFSFFNPIKELKDVGKLRMVPPTLAVAGIGGIAGTVVGGTATTVNLALKVVGRGEVREPARLTTEFAKLAGVGLLGTAISIPLLPICLITNGIATVIDKARSKDKKEMGSKQQVIDSSNLAQTRIQNIRANPHDEKGKQEEFTVSPPRF